jgi:hypothetical protein
MPSTITFKQFTILCISLICLLSQSSKFRERSLGLDLVLDFGFQSLVQSKLRIMHVWQVQTYSRLNLCMFSIITASTIWLIASSELIQMWCPAIACNRHCDVLYETLLGRYTPSIGVSISAWLCCVSTRIPFVLVALLHLVIMRSAVGRYFLPGTPR